MSPTRRYTIRHETIYSYGGEVALSHQLLHLSPRDRDNQLCLSRSIRLQPEPGLRGEHCDAFGNFVTRLEYDQPHARLEVCADIAVEVRPWPQVDAAQSVAWEGVHKQLQYSGKAMLPVDIDACQYRMQSDYVRLKQIFSDYAQDCFPPQQPIMVGAELLMQKIHREFRYVPGATDIKTSVSEVFAAKLGVCQDFAHVMIACLRSRGLSARYVSGYLRTIAPADAPALVGADASHAWVSVYCPPFGWIDFDPTNNVRANTDHITLGWGRDFGDVSPLRGVLVGGGRHQLRVSVSVRPYNAHDDPKSVTFGELEVRK